MYSDWTTQFFGGLAVEFWDRIAPAPSDVELNFLKSQFGDASRILDVACGSGRFTIPLAEAGYRMTGVDISTEFLGLAKSRAPQIDWHQADIRELTWDRAFDGALCFGNSFGYFPRNETRRFLARLAAALKPGARFVLETGATAESLLPSLQRERTIEAAGIVFRSSNAYDAKASRLDIEYTFEKDGAREVKRAQTFVFTAGEVVSMFEEARFAVENIFASAAGDPFVPGSPRAIFVAIYR